MDRTVKKVPATKGVAQKAREAVRDAIVKKMVAAPAKTDPESRMLASIHRSAAALESIGAISHQTMREFDVACLPPVPKWTGPEVAKVRISTGMSQPVFAVYMGTTKSTIQKWESGDQTPSGSAAKLLSVVMKHGADILV